MNDDRFDRDLAARLRAYESRLPEAPAPAPGSGRRHRSGLPVLLAGGTAVLAAVALALVVLQGWGRDRVGDPVVTPSAPASAAVDETAEPSAWVKPEPTPSPAASESSAAPSESPEPPPAELAWTATGSFPSDGSGPSMVQHIVAVDGGYVAAGVSYEARLPGVGPSPPHALGIWLSADGRTWEQVETQLENVEFSSLEVRPDGSLLAIGTVSTLSEFGYVEIGEPAAWASADGRAWSQVETGLPGFPVDIVHGGSGYVALVRNDLATQAYELWHSDDAAAWTLAHSFVARRIHMGAGAEGFVVVGRTPDDPEEAFALASGDGREWLTASNPPPVYAPLVAPRGGDWITMSAFMEEGSMATGETWASGNGLEWEPHGQAPAQRVEVDGVACEEFPRSLHSAGGWLVAALDLSGPCSEGSFVVHGTQLVSTDGATWTPLPFDVGTPGVTRSGAIVNAAIATGAGLLLGGELDGIATFWFGEQP